MLEIDAAIGRLVRGLKEQRIYEETVIVFSSDHGMSAFETKPVSIEPADALKKAGFNVATSNGQLKSDTEVIILAFGVRPIYFRNLPLARPGQAVKVLNTIKGVEMLDRKKLDPAGLS